MRTRRAPGDLFALLLGLALLLLLPLLPGSWLQPPAVSGADHRESSAIAGDPAADISDLYCFRSPADDTRLVFVLGVNPMAFPSENVTYEFSPDVLYQIHVDRNGDLAPDLDLSFVFGPREASAAQRVTCRIRGAGIDTTFGGLSTPPSEEATAPADVIIADPSDDRRRLFAGLKDDPFFFDVAAFNRVLAGGSFRNPGVDGFAGLNVSAIVVEIPAAQVATDGSNLGVWATTSRRGPGATLTPIQRMGRPAIKTVLIPRTLRNAFNRGIPRDDVRNFRASLIASLVGLGRNQTDAEGLADALLPDVLTIDVSQPTAFLNGRALVDDVIDAELTLLLGTPSTDNVGANDLAFPGQFPYLAGPQQP